MDIDTKALRALLDACVLGEWDASPSEHNLNIALYNAAPDLLDAADERDALRLEVARLRGGRVSDSHPYECRACHTRYTPTDWQSEDCPSCGCDGTPESIAALTGATK